MNFFDECYLKAKFKILNFVSDLKDGEEGVSNMVATVILILIVILIAAALWGFLSGWFSKIFEQIANGFKPKSTDIKTDF